MFRQRGKLSIHRKHAHGDFVGQARPSGLGQNFNLGGDGQEENPLLNFPPAYN